MNVRPLALCLMLILSVGASVALAAPAKTPTLDGDRRLPADEIEDLLSPEQWKVLRALPYRALVIFDSQIRSDGTVAGGTPRTSEPDATWTPPAKELLKKVRLKATSNGTHTLAEGEIFVIFYGAGPDRVALIYARQQDDPHPGPRGKAKFITLEKY